jgi:hypothetical protein
MSASEYENPNLRENQRRLTAAGDGACAPEQEVARSSRAGPTLRTSHPAIGYRCAGRFVFRAFPARGVSFVVPNPTGPSRSLSASRCCSTRYSTTSERWRTVPRWAYTRRGT